MRILYFLISTVSCFQLKSYIKPNLRLFNTPKKLDGYLSLIRYKNILPTTLLNLSGGWIMHPSIDIFYNIPFLISIINTILIMSSSIILNDIYDMEIDKINNTNRPLVTGKVTIKEAKLLVFTLLGLTEYLSIKFLDKNLDLIVQLSVINIIIYTPILKKITFIKNISCALLISFAPFFSGLAINNNNYSLLYTLSGIIFLGSLYSEILFDISDVQGDKKNNIITIPVKYGYDKSIDIIYFIIIINIIFTFINITLHYDIYYGLVLPVIFTTIFTELNKIKINNYSKNIISKTSGNINLYLFISLLYLCSLSK